MEQFTRKYPLYSLCGLNCGLCPNYHSDKAFQCTGCGGNDFSSIHPTCSIVTCSRKHDNIEFCFLCDEYPCDKYKWMNEDIIYDSFITYQNVVKDIEKVKSLGINVYYSELEEKTKLLEYLLKNYNAGRQKTFFCVAVNLLELEDTKNAISEINTLMDSKNSLKDNSKIAVQVFNELANSKNIILKLNKKK